MLSISKNFRVLYKLPSRIDRGTTLFRGAFCTVVEPVKSDDIPDIVDESPELPSWVKSPDNEKAVNKKKDDDFVPPSLSYWIENNEVCDQGGGDDMKSVVNDIIESDVDKISKILKNLFKSPDSVVEALEGCCDVDLSESLVEQILRRFSCEWIPAFGFFKWVELRNGVAHSPNLYNMMVDNLGKCKKFDVMWELLENMKRLERYVTLDTMAKVMKRLANASKYDDAIEAFKRVEAFGVKKDVIALNRLMDTLVKARSVEHADKVFLEFNKLIPPTAQTYNLLVHGWCRIRKIDKAKEITDEMKGNGFCPDAITYTSFIESYCREKDFRKVDSTLEEMEKLGLCPTVVTFTIIMNALAKARETDKAMGVYEKIKKKNCSPDAAFYNVFITALSRAGRLKDSDAVFEDMTKQGIAPETSTYNTLIFIAAGDSQEEKALKLLLKMEESGCKPNLTTYGPLLKMCCRLGRMKVLSFLLSHMFKNDVSIDLSIYTLLVNRLSKNGKLEQACVYFEEMVRNGYVPMDCTYDTLVDCLQKKGMLKEKQHIEELMVKAKEQGEDYSGKRFAKIDQE